MDLPELSSYSAAIAPEIDRLFISGHRSARPYARQIMADFSLSSFGVLVDFRKYLLSNQGMTFAQACALQRYRRPAVIRGDLQTHVEQHLLAAMGDLYIPTDHGRDILLRLTEALVRGTQGLWERLDGVDVAAALVSAAVANAADTAPATSFPAFAVNCDGFFPPDAPRAFLLWTQVGTLRYLRADAHALAWREHELASTQISILTGLWHAIDPLRIDQLAAAMDENEPSIQAAMLGLAERGLVSGSGEIWEISSRGRELRQRIEDQTNNYSASPFSALSPADRERLREILSSLPSSFN